MQQAALRAVPTRGAGDSADPPGARMVTLSETSRVPIILDGKPSGDVELERGTRLELVGEDGDFVRVKFLDSVVRVPRSKLSFR